MSSVCRYEKKQYWLYQFTFCTELVMQSVSDSLTAVQTRINSGKNALFGRLHLILENSAEL